MLLGLEKTLPPAILVLLEQDWTWALVLVLVLEVVPFGIIPSCLELEQAALQQMLVVEVLEAVPLGIVTSFLDTQLIWSCLQLS